MLPILRKIGTYSMTQAHQQHQEQINVINGLLDALKRTDDILKKNK